MNEKDKIEISDVLIRIDRKIDEDDIFDNDTDQETNEEKPEEKYQRG